MVNELGLPYSENVIEEIYYITRWSEIHDLIFKYNDKYYQCDYFYEAAEIQDEPSCEYVEEIECIEVEKKEIMVKKWIPKI